MIFSTKFLFQIRLFIDELYESSDRVQEFVVQSCEVDRADEPDCQQAMWFIDTVSTSQQHLFYLLILSK